MKIVASFSNSHSVNMKTTVSIGNSRFTYLAFTAEFKALFSLTFTVEK